MYMYVYIYIYVYMYTCLSFIYDNESTWYRYLPSCILFSCSCAILEEQALGANPGTTRGKCETSGRHWLFGGVDPMEIQNLRWQSTCFSYFSRFRVNLEVNNKRKKRIQIGVRVMLFCFMMFSWQKRSESRDPPQPGKNHRVDIRMEFFGETHRHTHTAEIEIEMNLEMNIYENSIVNNNLIQKTCMIPPLSDTTILWDSRKNRIQLIIEAMRKAQVWSAMEDVRWFLLPCQIFDQPG